MEVHHSHHPTHKKKWSEYLLEFFMLFLAVFLGFLVENQREHMVEKDRAKEYAKNFLIDLKNDTTELNNTIFFDKNTRLMIDSLVQLISTEDIHSKGGELYYISSKAIFFYTTDWNKATISQLVSSGNLRYFTNPQLVNKINVYNTITANISNSQRVIGESTHQSSIYANQIFKAASLLMFQSTSVNDIYTKQLYSDSLRHFNMPLQSYDEGLINAYGNAMTQSVPLRMYLLSIYPEAKKQAIEIIELLKKEYHLKDE
ncbi:MAG: hypothetical protein ABIO32_03790 [Ferruginibacter sp.]